MNQNRAKKIVSSPTMVDVSYNGTPIYIDSVNSIKGTATIHPLEQPGDRQEVLLTNLVEH